MWRRVKNSLSLALTLACIAVSMAPTATFASTHILSNICNSFAAPTVLTPAPNSTSQDATTSISGGGQPDLTVSVIENGTTVGMTTIASDGTYALEVPLVVGSNTLVIRGTDGCGVSEDSSPLTVTYVAPTTPSGGAATTVPQQSAGVSSSPSTPFVPVAVSSPVSQFAPPLTITPDYPQPTIVRPVDGIIVTTSQIWVSGSAPAGSVVTIYVNGRGVARVDASSTWTFAVLIELQPGNNTIKVSAGQGNNLSVSSAVNVTYNKPAAVSNVSTSITMRIAIAGTAAIVSGLAAVLVVRRINHARRS